MPVADPATYLSSLVTMLNLATPQNRTANLLFHGHSVPCGYAAFGAVNRLVAYPFDLLKRLNARFPNAVVNSVTTSIGGENSTLGAPRLATDVLGFARGNQASATSVTVLDVVFIDYAVNDYTVADAVVQNNWNSMIDACQAASVPVILLTGSPLNTTDLENPADALVHKAQLIRDMAAAQGVGLADTMEAFRLAVAGGTPLGNLLVSANHPNAAGHELMGGELIKYFPN